MLTANLVQTAYRFRNDDGNEVNATWKAALNTTIVQNVGETFRLRIATSETAGGSINNTSHALQYRINGGAWVTATTSTAVRFVSSANVADNTATTQQITNTTSTYVTTTTYSGDPSEIDSDGVVQNAPSWAGNDNVEYEAVLQLDSASIARDDVIEFQKSGLNGYSIYPSLTATIPAQNITESITLLNDNAVAMQNIMQTLQILNINSDVSVLFLGNVPKTVNALFNITSAYSPEILKSVIYAPGVYLATAQNMDGTKQVQTIEAWSDTQITWTAVQGNLPTETALELAVLTTNQDLVWSPVTVILTGGATLASISINSNSNIAVLKYLDTTQNTVVTSTYTLENIGALISFALLDLYTNITEQKAAQLIAAVTIALDKSNTIDFISQLITTQSVNLNNLNEVLLYTALTASGNLVFNQVLTSLQQYNVEFNTALLIESIIDYTQLNTFVTNQSLTFSKDTQFVTDGNALILELAYLTINQGYTLEETALLIATKLVEYDIDVDIQTFVSAILQATTQLNIDIDNTTLTTLLAAANIDLTSTADVSNISQAVYNTALNLLHNQSVGFVLQVAVTGLLNLSNNIDVNLNRQLVGLAAISLLNSNDISIDTLITLFTSLNINTTYLFDLVIELYADGIIVVPSIEFNRAISLSNAININVTVEHILSTICYLLLSQNYSIEYLVSNVINKVVNYNIDFDVATFAANIITLAAEFDATIDFDTLNSIITSQSLDLTNSISIVFLSEVFGTLVAQLVLSSLTNLNYVNTLITDVVTLIESNYSAEVAYQFITNVIISIANNIDVNANTSLITDLVLQLTKSATVTISPLGQVVEYLVLNTSMTIENTTTLISTVITTLVQDISYSAAASFITTVVSSLVYSQNIDIARTISKIGILTLLNTTSLENTVNLVAQVYTILESVLDCNTNRLLSHLALMDLNSDNSIELSALGVYLVNILFDDSITTSVESTATLKGNVSLNTLVRTTLDLLFENEARINLSHAVTTSITSFSEVFAILELLFNKDVTNEVARLVFGIVDLNTSSDITVEKTLETLQTISLDYDQTLLNNLSRDLAAALSLSSDSNVIALSTLTLTGELTLSYEVQKVLNRLGVLNSEIQIQNAVSLQLLKTAFLQANIAVNNLVVVETSYGLDIFVETSDQRIFIVKFDSRSLEISFEGRAEEIPFETRNIEITDDSREISISLENRTKTIPGNS